jgi:hypothetical protein
LGDVSGDIVAGFIHQLTCGDELHYLSGWDECDLENFSYKGFNGLVATLNVQGQLAEPGVHAVVMTGTDTGPIALTVELLDAPPGAVDTESWAEVVDFSPAFEDGDLVVSTVNDTGDEEFPDFSDLPPGPYRVRLHARGRDQANEDVMVEDEPIEEHLLQVWPAPSAPSEVHKVTDAYGAEIWDC